MSDALEVFIAPEIENDVRALLTWWREHRPESADPRTVLESFMLRAGGSTPR